MFWPWERRTRTVPGDRLRTYHTKISDSEDLLSASLSYHQTAVSVIGQSKVTNCSSCPCQGHGRVHMQRSIRFFPSRRFAARFGYLCQRTFVGSIEFIPYPLLGDVLFAPSLSLFLNKGKEKQKAKTRQQNKLYLKNDTSPQTVDASKPPRSRQTNDLPRYLPQLQVP